LMLIDLHTHSTFSDGTFTPEALVRLAKAKNVKVLALTDHDTVAGVPSFMSACKKYGLQCISGIELSADAPWTVHIAGYRMGGDLAAMDLELEGIRRKRDERNRKMCDRLGELGMDVSMEELRDEAGGDVIARPHMAGVMLKKGFVSSRADAFARFLGKDGAAYVSRERLSAAGCIDLVKRSGGLPVLAHPDQMAIDDDEKVEFISELADMGLWGLECISGRQDHSRTLFWMGVAKKLRLFQTAGSDFHGNARPGASLGVSVSDTLLPWARLGVLI